MQWPAFPQAVPDIPEPTAHQNQENDSKGKPQG